MLRTQLIIIAIATALAACETPRDKATADASVQQTPSVDADVETLVQRVQQLRDRSFKKPPRFEVVESLDEANVAGTDAYRRDREALTTVLFGTPDASGTLPTLSETRVARFFPQENVIRYVDQGDPGLVTRALIFALVDALDRESFASPSEATSWDQALAQSAAHRSTGAMAWVTYEASDKDLTAEVVARRPEVALQLKSVSPRLWVAAGPQSLASREGAFAVREGFALAAALYRAGGWSTLELAAIDPPSATGWVVRPDRWLGGEGIGAWTWSDTKTQLIDDGFKNDTSGTVGPAVIGFWLSEQVAPTIARTIYTSWQSDAYRFWQKDDIWTFEWVSMWKTPTDAQHVAGALEKGFSRREDAQFQVLAHGTNVSVVATSQTIDDDHLVSYATEIAGMSPRFEAGDRPMVNYVPTPFDTYLLGLSQAKLDLDNRTWTDPVAHLTLDLKSLADWKLQKTESAAARWVATTDLHTILMTTELVDPLAPAFETPAFEKTVAKNFQASMRDVDEAVTRVDFPVADTLRVHVRGTLDTGDVATITAHIFRVGDVIVTFSLKSTGQESGADTTYDSLVKGLVIEADTKKATGSGGDKGIIQFEVED